MIVPTESIVTEPIRTVYVHSGSFNLDDILSAALLKQVYSDIAIIRKDDAESYQQDEILLQSADCLTELVFEGMKELLFTKERFHNQEKAILIFRKRYVERLKENAPKGYRFMRGIPDSNVIASFIPYSYEEREGIDMDAQFLMAVDFAAIVIENWIKMIYEETELQATEARIWREAESKSNDGIFVLERHIPWQHQVKMHPASKAKIIIFRSRRGGYNLVSRDSREIQIKEDEHLSFLHPSHHMGVSETLEGAMLAARHAVECALNR